MEARITKTRAAMAAVLVLAGVGLASLLSPLVGSAQDVRPREEGIGVQRHRRDSLRVQGRTRDGA